MVPGARDGGDAGQLARHPRRPRGHPAWLPGVVEGRGVDEHVWGAGGGSDRDAECRLPRGEQ
eukprot:11218000-Alexandrium_andersonii.AAC.1